MGETSPTAWQPFTPCGVAAFAAAPLRRLLLVQLIVAFLVALGVAWFCYDRYVPVITSAIEKLPAEGRIRQQQLEWPGNSPVVLAENQFLCLTVDLERTGQLRSVAHLQFDFCRSRVVIHSILGYAEVTYPKGWVIAANREELQPLWGAWRPALLVGLMAVVILWLLVSWFGLALAYVLPLSLLGFFLNRQLDRGSGWRLGGAALLPGALLMLAGISFYDLGALDLVGLAFVFVAHLVAGWVYLVLGLLALPRVKTETGTSKNPFAARKQK